MNGGTVVAIIGMLAALFLAVRAAQGRPMPMAQRLTQAAIWGVIIVIVALVISWFGGEGIR